MSDSPIPSHDGGDSVDLSNHRLGRCVDRPDDVLLNEVYQLIVDRQVWIGMKTLVEGLDTKLRKSTEREWKEFVDRCRAGPLLELIHEDPLTRKASAGSRGHPDLLELIHSIEGDGSGLEHASWTGSQIFEFLMASPLCRGVVSRARHIVEAVNRTAANCESPEILAVVSGHLREVDLVDPTIARRIRRWVAYDADQLAVSQVRRRYSHLPVHLVVGGTDELLRPGTDLGQFDLIYSIGGFEDIEQPVGVPLVRELFARLRPGGELMITNLAEDINYLGYTACYMDWRPILRDDRQMRELGADLSDSRIAHSRLTGDDTQTVLMLSLVKK